MYKNAIKKAFIKLKLPWNIYYQSKDFGHPQTFLFLILKVLFLMKQIKYHNSLIYYAKYKSSRARLNTN